MPNSNFVDKVIGKGEISIEKADCFREASEDEHDRISKSLLKRTKKDIISSAMLIIASCIFIAMYIYFYCNNSRNSYFLVASAVFAFLDIAAVFHIIVLKKIQNNVKERKYTVSSMRIHHLMPSLGVNAGKTIAKAQDDNGQVYSYEFEVPKAVKSLYKKNNNEKFIVVKINFKKMYFLVT